jgi:hypothetical protein
MNGTNSQPLALCVSEGHVESCSQRLSTLAPIPISPSMCAFAPFAPCVPVLGCSHPLECDARNGGRPLLCGAAQGPAVPGNGSSRARREVPCLYDSPFPSFAWFVACMSFLLSCHAAAGSNFALLVSWPARNCPSPKGLTLAKHLSQSSSHACFVTGLWRSFHPCSRNRALPNTRDRLTQQGGQRIHNRSPPSR